MLHPHLFQVFRLIGFLDARYFVYFEDVDFMYRAMKASVKLVYLPGTTLLHRVNALTGTDSEFTIRYINRNYLYFLLKHLGMWKTAPLWVANQAYFSARLLLTFDTPRFFAKAGLFSRSDPRCIGEAKNA